MVEARSWFVDSGLQSRFRIIAPAGLQRMDDLVPRKLCTVHASAPCANHEESGLPQTFSLSEKKWPGLAMALEILHGSFVGFGCLEGFEGSQIAALVGLGILFARIEAELSGL